MKMRLMVLFGLLWSLTAVAETDYPPVSVEMELQKVSEHTYFVQGKAGAAFEHEGFVSNAGAIITGDGVIIIDSLGSPSLAHKFLTLLREVTDQPVRKVILTHYHADHIYGLQVFKDLGAEIIAPKGANDYLNAPQAQERLEERRFSLEPWVNEKTRLVSPDRILTEDQTMEVGEVTLRISLLGSAHSDGDLAVFVEPDHVLYSGDIIFEGRVPFVGNANTRNWLDALERMRSVDVKALIPGHGPKASDPNQAVATTYDYLTYLREELGKAVEDFVPFAEAYESIDWSDYEKLPAFGATHRRNAYQVYLSLEAESLSQ